MTTYCKVAVRYPKLPSVLTYKIPESMSLDRGHLVEVPLGRRKEKGVVFETGLDVNALSEEEKKFKLKEVENVFADDMKVSEKELVLYQWIAHYYHYSPGQLIFDCYPKILKRPRKFETIIGEGRDFNMTLTDNQNEIYQALKIKLEEGFNKSLIHGITGSGKSVIYLKLIIDCLAKGKSAHFLLPEINLTPQFLDFFKTYLNVPIISYHSSLTNSEKYLTWKFIKEAKGPLLIMGVRSSLFLPINNLGLIIVDEEHDSSFKQTDRCPYNGRDVAIKKCHFEKIPIVLGSATPTLENYHLFKKNNSYYSLNERIGSASLPIIELVDVKGRFSAKQIGENDHYPLSHEILTKLKETLKKKEQALVFINKLGFANFLQCRSCGHRFKNESCGCELSLRFFKKRNELSCSQC